MQVSGDGVLHVPVLLDIADTSYSRQLAFVA